MKKEDFFGKYILRDGDLRPKEINEYSWRVYHMTIQYCEDLASKGLVFDSYAKADTASRNAVVLIAGINNGTYIREENIAEAPRKPRVYISGPISGHDTNDCIKRFEEAKQRLEEKGYRVFNPLENGLPFDASTHRHMRRDLNVLTNEEDPFDYIYMMKRWPHSSGCKNELDNAIACGISVMWEESEEITKFE